MRTIPINEMTFQEMQIFLSAGQELNFTRTAEKCFVTQPTVSRVIDSIEKKSGIQLFIKSHGKLRLSPAGKALHRNVQGSLAMLQEGFERAWEIQEGFRKFINIGIISDIDPTVFSDCAQRYRKQEQDARIYLKLIDNISSGIQRLLTFKLDIYITFVHESVEAEPFSEFTIEPLCEVPLACFMTKKNPLSSKKEIHCKDLQSQKIILPILGTNRMYEDMFMEAMTKSGVVPMISARVANADEALLNLYEDNEVVILNRYKSQNEIMKKLTQIPITDSKSGLIAIYRTADKSQPVIRELLNEIKELLISN